MSNSIYQLNSLNNYMKSFEGIDFLPAETVTQTVLEAKTGNKRAIDLIVYSFQKFIIAVAKKYGFFSSTKSDDLEDLMTSGSIGLMDAIRLFNPDKGSPFISCAEYCIRNRLGENARETSQFVHIPREKAAKLNKIKVILNNETSSTLDNETMTTIMNETGFSENEITEVLKCDFNVQSFSIKAENEDDCDLLDVLPDTRIPDANDLVIEEDIKLALSTALGTLSQKEQEILKEYFGYNNDPKSCSQIAKKLSVTRQRVQQILKNATTKLRENDELRKFYDAA